MADPSRGVQQGLLDRVSGIFGLVKHFPDNLSDEAVAGVMHALPPDLTKTIDALMVDRFRGVSIKFLKILGTWMNQAKAKQAAGGKVFLVPFNFPPEILYWFKSAAPLTSEVLSTLGVAGLEGQGERYWDYAMGLGLPDFSCSANMIEVGSVLTSVDFKPDAIISDCFASCDINSKTHEFLARYMDIPLLFLEKPVDNGERGVQQYYRYFEKLMSELEEFLGEKLDVDR
ncbi:MAG: 2-hydroxyacyl-CoA dehydratase, partial [Candidatus Geothermincolia bacterium]